MNRESQFYFSIRAVFPKPVPGGAPTSLIWPIYSWAAFHLFMPFPL